MQKWNLSSSHHRQNITGKFTRLTEKPVASATHWGDRAAAAEGSTGLPAHAEGGPQVQRQHQISHSSFSAGERGDSSWLALMPISLKILLDGQGIALSFFLHSGLWCMHMCDMEVTLTAH